MTHLLNSFKITCISIRSFYPSFMEGLTVTSWVFTRFFNYLTNSWKILYFFPTGVAVCFRCHVEDTDATLHCGDARHMNCSTVQYTPFCHQIPGDTSQKNGVCTCEKCEYNNKHKIDIIFRLRHFVTRYQGTPHRTAFGHVTRVNTTINIKLLSLPVLPFFSPDTRGHVPEEWRLHMWKAWV